MGRLLQFLSAAAATTTVVSGETTVVLPVGGGADLVCDVDRSSLVDCARTALSGAAPELTLDDSDDLLRRDSDITTEERARLLVRSGLKALAPRGLAAMAARVSKQNATLAEGALRRAADDVGGFFCQGDALTPTWRHAAAAVARAVGADVVDAASSASSPSTGGVVVRKGTTPCAGPTSPTNALRGLFDGGVDVVTWGNQHKGWTTRDPNELVFQATTVLAGESGTGSSVAGCSPDEAEALADLWSRRPRLGDLEAWEYASLMGCPRRKWFQKNAFVGRERWTLAMVGANKGYGLAHALKVLAPHLGITPRRWSRALRAAGAPLACGWCRECLEDDPLFVVPPTTTTTTVVAHLVEPLEANVRLIEDALDHLGFVVVDTAGTKKTWTLGSSVEVHAWRLAVGAENGVARFPRLRPGAEVGAVCGGESCDAAAFEGHFADGASGIFDEVRVATLDTLFAHEPLDALFVDAEGQDPLILAGGRAVLPHLTLLEFEYHFRGAWASTSLARVITELSTFDCFLQAPADALWRLSRGCWHAAFEIRQWSNVVCGAHHSSVVSDALAPFAVVLPPPSE